MSGLEPLVALGLACNAIQLIGNARDAVLLLRKVYQNGELDAEITEKAKILKATSEKLWETLAPIEESKVKKTVAPADKSKVKKTVAPADKSKVKTITPFDKSQVKAEDMQLFVLVEKCWIAAHDLQEEVTFLNGHRSKLELVTTLKITAKTMWRKRRLEKHDRHLREAEKILRTGLLAKIYERAIKIESDLHSLDSNLKTFIVEYRAGNKNAVASITKHTTSIIKQSEAVITTHIDIAALRIGETVQSHIQSAAKRASGDHERRRAAERLLQSLKYDRMNERRNHARLQHHSDTFKWVFNDGSENDKAPAITTPEDASNTNQNSPEFPSAGISWNSFCDWLRSTEIVYWISGKAGSGKSTLVRFLSENAETHRHLDVWKPETIVLSHFLWSSGTEMQKNIKGLLCSLVHQLFTGNPDALNWAISNYDGISMNETDSDWTENGLQLLFEAALTRADRSPVRPITIFLDGLDEISPKDGVVRLMSVIDKLNELGRRTGKLKLCLASRPESFLTNRLGKHAKLRLEELNKDDLYRYASNEIIIPADYRPQPSEMFDWRLEMHARYHRRKQPISSQGVFHDWLVESLVDKAEGVFLWLWLTVAQIQKALTENESMEDVELRIINLPGELSELYSDMWNRANDGNDQLKARGALYLQLVLASQFHTETPHYHFAMILAANTGLASRVMHQSVLNPVPFKVLNEACEWTKQDVLSRCAGLLQISDSSQSLPGFRYRNPPWDVQEYQGLERLNYDGPDFTFSHRTAGDFLIDTKAGTAILDCSKQALETTRAKLLEAQVITASIFEGPLWFLESNVHTIAKDVSITDSLGRIFEDICRCAGEYDTTLTSSTALQVFRTCEQLFNRGYLSGPSYLPARSMQYTATSMAREYKIASESTAHVRHGFLLEAVCHVRDIRTFRSIIQLMKERRCDINTTSTALIYLCDITRLILSKSGRLTTLVEDLIDLGASPTTWQAYRPCSMLYDSHEMTFFMRGNAMQVLVMAILNLTMVQTTAVFEDLHIGEAVSNLIRHGASLQEEIPVIVGLSGGRAFIQELWENFGSLIDRRPAHSGELNPQGRQGAKPERAAIGLVVALPAWIVLTLVGKLHCLGLTAELKRLAEHDAANEGRHRTLIAVLDITSERKETRYRRSLAPDILQASHIYPKSMVDYTDSSFNRLVQLVVSSLSTMRWVDGNIEDVSNTDLQLPSMDVPIQQPLQESISQALETMRDQHVPVKVRRKEFRELLGIETRIEEEEWQYGNYSRQKPFPDAMYKQGNFEWSELGNLERFPEE